MNTGEVLRRTVFNLLDASKGGKLQKLKEVNKREIVEGVTEEYMERRLKTLLDYVKKNSSCYRKHPEWKELKDFPVISKWKSFKNNLIMVDISNMGDESLEKICRDIEKKKIQVLVPYSSALTALTQYLKRTKRDISRWQVEMIYTMGEALPQETYDLAKELFGFTPVRTYGNNENGFIAVQLGEDPEYSIDMFNYYPEILKMDCDEPAEARMQSEESRRKTTACSVDWAF